MNDGLQVRIHAMARRMAGRSLGRVEADDLVQEGLLATLTASRRFQEGRGASRETFLMYRVRGAMIDAVRKEMWPRNIRAIYRELQTARDALRRDTGASPSLAEVADHVGRSEASVRDWSIRFQALQTLASSDPRPDDQLQLLDVPDQWQPAVPMSPDEYVERQDLYARVSSAIRRLPVRDQRVLQHCYREDGSQASAAKALGLSYGRVSQLHTRAIGKLRAMLHAAV